MQPAEATTQPAATSPAPTSGQGGLRLERIARHFDFEERKHGNTDRMPMFWFRINARGYPIHTDIGFDTDFSTSPDHSLKLQLNGGSAGVVLQSGTIAAMPLADYLITAKVRTAGAEHSRARVTAYFVDAHDRRVDDSLRHSRLTVSNDEWTSIQIQLPGSFTDAAWLKLQLELVQPDQQGRTALGLHELAEHDITAAAWFDDVVIYQLPRLQLTGPSPTGVVRGVEQVVFDVDVFDLVGEDMAVELRLYDQAGRLIAQTKQQLGSADPTRWRWRPDVQRTGWYIAELLVRSGARRVGRARTALAVLPQVDRASSPDDRRFMIVAEDLPKEQRPLLGDLLQRIDGSAVLLSTGRNTWTNMELRRLTDRGDPVIDRLLRDKVDLTFSVSNLPLRWLDEAGEFDATTADVPGSDDLWATYLEAMLMRYGQRVCGWVVGPSAAPVTADADLDSLARQYVEARELLGQYAAAAEFLRPWSAQQQLDAAALNADGLMVHFPASIRPSQIPAYIDAWPQAARPKATAYLQTLPPGPIGHDDRAADLALRMIGAWRGSPRRLAIEQPWQTGTTRQPSLLPDPLLCVWSNVAHQLSGRRVIAPVRLADGVECYLLAGRSGGALVAWRDSASQSDAALGLFLGPEPVAVDVWGHRTPLEQRDGKHHWRLGPTPQFVEGINVPLARMRAAFAVEPDFVESAYRAHHHVLKLFNPFGRTMSGRLYVTGPKHWKIEPRSSSFFVPPQQTRDIPLQLTFPISELAGPKKITTVIEFDTDRHYRIEMAAPLRIGLRNVQFHATAMTEPNRKDPDGSADVVISQAISNIGDEPQSLHAFAQVQGLARQERTIASLPPGRTVVRSFRFAGAADQLSGVIARVGLRQADGPGTYNQLVTIP